MVPLEADDFGLQSVIVHLTNATNAINDKNMQSKQETCCKYFNHYKHFLLIHADIVGYYIQKLQLYVKFGVI